MGLVAPQHVLAVAGAVAVPDEGAPAVADLLQKHDPAVDLPLAAQIGAVGVHGDEALELGAGLVKDLLAAQVLVADAAHVVGQRQIVGAEPLLPLGHAHDHVELVAVRADHEPEDLLPGDLRLARREPIALDAAVRVPDDEHVAPAHGDLGAELRPAQVTDVDGLERRPVQPGLLLELEAHSDAAALAVHAQEVLVLVEPGPPGRARLRGVLLQFCLLCRRRGGQERKEGTGEEERSCQLLHVFASPAGKGRSDVTGLTNRVESR